MTKIRKFDIIFAVMDETIKKSPRLIGTAFSLGKGVFATAGHVASEIEKSKYFTLM